MPRDNLQTLYMRKYIEEGALNEGGVPDTGAEHPLPYEKVYCLLHCREAHIAKPEVQSIFGIVQFQNS